MSMALAGQEQGAPSTSVSTRTRSLKRGEIRSAHAIFSSRKTWCVQKATNEANRCPSVMHKGHSDTLSLTDAFSMQHP